MPNTMMDSSFILVISTFSLFLFYPCFACELKACGFDAIYQFGDSMSDTGNSIQVFPRAFHSHFPFGMTIKNATGRPSDGFLLIDFVAQSAGLPFLDAYLNPHATDFSHGVDFAFAGATALPVEVLAKWNITTMFTRSLNVQLGWFDTFLKLRVCNHSEDCHRKLKSALFMVGEIGYNDYNFAISSGKTIEEVKQTMVPVTIQTIKDVVKSLIENGASQVAVNGIFQMGCSPFILTTFQTNDSAAYDQLHCLKDFNCLSKYHKYYLQKAINELKKEYPNVNIIYGDLYKAYQWVLDRLSSLGFTTLSEACCGIGGKQHASLDKTCGAPNVPFCLNPEQHIYWDETGHWTQATNKHAAKQFVEDIFPQLHCKA